MVLEKSVTVSALAIQLDVTEETIRRDLKSLEQDDVLSRAYGGAYILEGVQNEVNVNLRANLYWVSENQWVDDYFYGRCCRNRLRMGVICVQIRGYRPEDLPNVLQIFYNTVHAINAQDYSEEQLDAWTRKSPEQSARWAQTLAAHNTLVAEIDGTMVGFADMDAIGYLDHLFVHMDYQRNGIATALCDKLEGNARMQGVTVVSTHASITAKPFFTQRGYITLKEQHVQIAGVSLTNFVMEKTLD